MFFTCSSFVFHLLSSAELQLQGLGNCIYQGGIIETKATKPQLGSVLAKLGNNLFIYSRNWKILISDTGCKCWRKFCRQNERCHLLGGSCREGDPHDPSIITDASIGKCGGGCFCFKTNGWTQKSSETFYCMIGNMANTDFLKTKALKYKNSKFRNT